MPEKVVIVGPFQEVIELAEDCGAEVVGLIDRVHTGHDFGYPMLCKDEDLAERAPEFAGLKFILSPDTPEIRQRLQGLISPLGLCFASLVSPAAKISRTAFLDNGVLLQWGVNVSAGTRIGRFVRLNTGANVMHDSIIGEFSTIAPNAVVLGRVRIGNACYIGANSTILPNVNIGRGSIVGAGAVVTKDVPAGVVVAGNPARVLRSRSIAEEDGGI